MVMYACNPSYLRGWGRRIVWTKTQEVEVAVSQDHTTALQPGLQSKTLSQKQNKTKQKNQGLYVGCKGVKVSEFHKVQEL